MNDIEAIARAMWESEQDISLDPWESISDRALGNSFRSMARAALLETLRQIREPGEGAIFEATCEYQNHVAGRDPDAMFEALWQAMIDHLISEAEGE